MCGGVLSKPKMTRWITLPEKSMNDWLGQWLTASLVLRAHEVGGKFPKRVRIRSGNACIVPQKDGSGLLHYEAQF